VGWVFGNKLYLACSTGMLIVPLSADFTTANITDNKIYESITSSLPTGMVRYVVGDEGYDDHKLCDQQVKYSFLYFHCKGMSIQSMID